MCFGWSREGRGRRWAIQSVAAICLPLSTDTTAPFQTPLQRPDRPRSDFTLPDYFDMPAGPTKRFLRSSITMSVARQLTPPECFVGLWPAELRACMLMPEASVNKNRCAKGGEHQIRTSRQVAPVQAEAKTCCVQRTAYNELGLGVLSLNGRHVATAGRGDRYLRQLHPPAGAQPGPCQQMGSGNQTA